MKPFTYHVSLFHDREHNRFTVICEEFPELIATGNSPAGARDGRGWRAAEAFGLVGCPPFAYIVYAT